MACVYYADLAYNKIDGEGAQLLSQVLISSSIIQLTCITGDKRDAADFGSFRQPTRIGLPYAVYVDLPGDNISWVNLC